MHLQLYARSMFPLQCTCPGSTLALKSITSLALERQTDKPWLLCKQGSNFAIYCYVERQQPKKMNKKYILIETISLQNFVNFTFTSQFED